MNNGLAEHAHDKTRPKVLVLMATYNGERFVASQIDSILNQQDVDVELLIRDDGSTDSTCDICQSIADGHDCIHFQRNPTNVGVAENFMGMLFSSAADGYDLYAFSDQDDEWYPQKLSTAALALRWQELNQPPRLYFSDIQNEWVDENDNCVKREREISRFRGCENAPMTLLVRNWVNGCAMVFNSQLRDLLLTYRPNRFPRIHDVWVHMVARYCGEIVGDYDSVLVRRRITGNNVVGRTEMRTSSFHEVARVAKQLAKTNEHPMSECAALILEGFGEYVHLYYREPILQFVTYRASLSKRIALMLSKAFWLPSRRARIRMRIAMLLGFY